MLCLYISSREIQLTVNLCVLRQAHLRNFLESPVADDVVLGRIQSRKVNFVRSGRVMARREAGDQEVLEL